MMVATRTKPEVTTLNQRIFDRFLRRAHDVERARAGITRDTIRGIDTIILGNLEARLAVQLSRIRSRGDVAKIQTTKGWANLRRLVSDQMRSGFATVRGDLAGQLRELALQESRFVINALGQEFKFDFSAKVPSLDEFRKLVNRQPIAGRTLGDWFAGLAKKGTDDTLRDVRLGLSAGESTDEILRRLRSKGGAFQQATRAAESIVDTAVTHASDGGQDLAIQENAEVVEDEMWTAVLDSSTCPICAGLDGKVFKVGEGPRPGESTHPGCRCARIPRIKSAKELGLKEGDLPEIEREAMDGSVPEKTTYAQWLRGQPVHIQDEVLGATRARLWRGGKVTIDRMVDARLRPLTLPELARKADFDLGAAVKRTRAGAAVKAAETRAAKVEK